MLKITGGPATGKTTIFRFVLESLKTRAKPDTLLCYYLFHDRDVDHRGSTMVLRSLIFQILTQQPSLFELIHEDFKMQGVQYMENFFGMWRNLRSFLQAIGEQVVYILLDALNECAKTSRADLLSVFSSLQDTLGETATVSIKFLLTTRPEDDIEEYLARWPSLKLASVN